MVYIKNFHLTHKNQLPELTGLLSQAVSVGEHVIEIRKRVKRRSISQNSALHLWFTMLSEVLNDAGYSQRGLMAQMKLNFDIPITEHFLKEIFKKIVFAMHGKDSTAKLTTKEIQEVYLGMDARLRELTGCGVEWPSDSPPIYEGVTSG